MIASFRDEETRIVFEGRRSRHYPADIQNTARRKLVSLNQARELRDLASPPGNRLESLKRDRFGQHSIRVNDQWRICFIWRDALTLQDVTAVRAVNQDADGQDRDERNVQTGNAHDVEIVDYH